MLIFLVNASCQEEVGGTRNELTGCRKNHSTYSAKQVEQGDRNKPGDGYSQGMEEHSVRRILSHKFKINKLHNNAGDRSIHEGDAKA